MAASTTTTSSGGKSRPPAKVRFVTYMCPSLPVEYFATIAHYVEAKLGVHTTLQYETRWEGPPDDRPDPFAENEVDIAFLNTPAYMKMKDSKNKSVELLPVSSVHVHRKGEDAPAYFADVITHAENKGRVKSFIDLRGSKWAVNNPESMSGNILTMMTLKQLGENSAFFGSILQSGSHGKSIEMVLSKQADAAAVDANCLAHFCDTHPQQKQQLYVVESWGPLAPYPIVVNTRIPGELKFAIVKALLQMHEDRTWGPLLSKFHVHRFAKSSPAAYQKEQAAVHQVSECSIDSVYY